MTSPKVKLNNLLKSFQDAGSARTSGKTDTNKLIQLSQFMEYLQSLKTDEISSISKELETALLNTIIPHPQVSHLVYRDLVGQICILAFKANSKNLRDFYINLQSQLQNNRSNSLRLTILHIMGVLSAHNGGILWQYLSETCGILLKTAKSNSLSVRIGIVECIKNCIIGAQSGIKSSISDIIKLCDKISRDRNSRVRVALSQVILLMSHYYPDNLKIYISLIRKQCNVKHHNVRHAYGDILGKIIARTIPADIETAKREKRRKQQEKEAKQKANADKNKSKKSNVINKVISGAVAVAAAGANDNDSDDDDGTKRKQLDDDLASSIIDFESGFFAALALFDKLRSSSSSSSSSSSWFGLTAGTQLLMSFLRECMLLSRFDTGRLTYVLRQILRKLRVNIYTNKSRKSKMGKMGKMMISKVNKLDDAILHDVLDDGIISCMSYVLRYGLFKYFDQSSQNKAISFLVEYISKNNHQRSRQQIYLCLNCIGYLLYLLKSGCYDDNNNKLINDIFLMCLKYTTHTSHAIRNKSSQCLSLLSIANPDQCFVWADGLIKEISATLSTIDSSDPSKMYLLHGRSIALSEIIKIIPQLDNGVPSSVSSKAFSVAVDLFNVDIQEDVSFNLEASSILTVCGWILIDSLIHLGTSWANTKIKTLLNIWREVFSQTEFKPNTSSEAISLIYVKQAAYHSMLTFVKIFEKQIPIHPDLQVQIVKRLQHALDFEKYINNIIHDKTTNKLYENILTPAVRHQLSRLRALMMNIFSFLSPTMYERHVTLLKLANANFSHRKAVTSNELEHLLDYEDDILCQSYNNNSYSNTNTNQLNTLCSRSATSLNIFIEYISNPTIDELGLEKSWMPQDLMHSILFQFGIIHDKQQINLHKSTKITSKLAEIYHNISPHLSYSHYISSKGLHNKHNNLLNSMTIGGIMMNEKDIELSINNNNNNNDDDQKDANNTNLTPKEIANKEKQQYNNKILSIIQEAQTEQSMRLIPRLTMSYFQKENCDANLRLFCKLFPYQNEQHKLKLVQHFVEVAKDAKLSDKSESLKIVLQNSAAVILGCCKCMLENNIKFGKGKVRDSVLRIASDFLAFNNPLVMRAGAQVFGILSKMEDNAFKHTIIQYLYKKKFGEDKPNIRAASALALGCIHQYSGSKENLGFTVAALQLLERDGNVSLWLLHSLQRILHVLNNPSKKSNNSNNNKKKKKITSSVDDDEAICRNILGFTLSILADEKDSVDYRVLNALLEILNILLTRIVNKTKAKNKLIDNSNNGNNDNDDDNLLNTIIFMLKFIERLNIPELHGKLLECAGKISLCSPSSIVNLDNDNKNNVNIQNNNRDALDAQQYIIHQLQRCLFSGDIREKVLAMDALKLFALHSPSILISKNILHSLLYLLDVNATTPIIYNRALSSLQVVTSLYGKKYPQSLLKYFRTISLRGMILKPPEISQLLSLLAQDLVIKKITKKKTNDNEWVIIPPSLNCLRYSSSLWIQIVVKNMLNYAIKKGNQYMDVIKAKKSLNNMIKNNNDNNNTNNDEIESKNDYEYLILSIHDLVQLVCKECSCKYPSVRKKSLECLHEIIKYFSILPFDICV